MVFVIRLMAFILMHAVLLVDNIQLSLIAVRIELSLLEYWHFGNKCSIGVIILARIL